MIIILCNTNSQENAELIAQTLVSEELCACVNIIPKIQSIYKWQGKIENDTEFLMLIKTKKLQDMCCGHLQLLVWQV